MKRLLLLGALLTFSTPALAYHDIEYIPGTIPGCDRINGVYVCKMGMETDGSLYRKNVEGTIENYHLLAVHKLWLS